MMKNGQLKTKKFGIDWPDCMCFALHREERSSLSLIHYLHSRLCRTELKCLNVTGNPLHKRIKGVMVNFYFKFSCSFRKGFCLSLIFVFKNNIVF